VLETVHEESDDLEREVLGDSLISFAIQNSVDHNKVSQNKADEIFKRINERIKLIPTHSSREPRLKIKSQVDQKTKKHKILDKISEKFQIEFLV
jgi:fibronectin type 3 domain-containing protein